MPVGWFRIAALAAEPSPLKPSEPLPTTVLMLPLAASTRRMRASCRSTMKKSPAAFTAMAYGSIKPARVAALPSPEYPICEELPAQVLILPSLVMRRMRALPVSAM